MATRLGVAYVELDMDFTPFRKAQTTLVNESREAGRTIEENFKRIGVTSDNMYQAMANRAVKAYEAITAAGTKSADELFRAQSAVVAKVNTLNSQMNKNPLYETLGIKSVAAIEAQKAAIISSYDTIQKSGTASAQDLINIERAKNAKLKELDKEMVGEHERSMASMARAVLRFYAAWYVASTAVIGIKSLFMGGVTAIDDLKTNTIATAAIITNMQGTTGNVVENYRKNLVYAEALNKKMMEIDANSSANYEQLQNMNRAAVGHGVILDVNNKKQIDAYTAISNAVANLTKGQNQDIQFSQEINALMSGRTKDTDKVAKNIDAIIKQEGKYKDGLKEVVELGQKHNDTWERLAPYFAGFNAAAGDISQTWSAISSSMQTAWGVLQRGLFKDFYKDLTSGGRNAADWMKENTDSIIESINAAKEAIEFSVGVMVAAFLVFEIAAAKAALSTGKIWKDFAIIWDQLTTAVTLSTSKMTLAFSVFVSALAGWEIGQILNKFETIRQAGVYMVYGIINAWNWMVNKIEVGWQSLKMLKSGLFASDDEIKRISVEGNARISAINKEYEAEKKIRDGFRKDQLKSVTDAAMAEARAKANVKSKTDTIKIGKMGGTGEDGSIGGATKAAENLAKQWEEMKMTLEAQIEGTGMSQLKKNLIANQLEADKLIDKYKSIPGAIDLINKAHEAKDNEDITKAEDKALEAAEKRIKEQTAADEKIYKAQVKAAKDKADAEREIYKDMRQYSGDFYKSELKLIDEKAEHYKQLGIDQIAIAQWVAEETRKAEIAKLKFSEDTNDGIKAYLLERQRDYLTMAQAGYNIIKQEVEGFQSTLSDVLFDGMKGDMKSFQEYWDKFADALLRKFTDTIAQMAVEWALGISQTGGSGSGFLSLLSGVARLVNGGVGIASSLASTASAASSAAYTASAYSSLASLSSSGYAMLYHDGGVVGESSVPTRVMPAMSWVSVPRYHNGLLSDEFPAVLQKGETVLPRGKSASGGSTAISINIVAADAKSFEDMCKRNPGAIINPITNALQNNRINKQWKGLLQ